MKRRSLLKGMAGILAASYAPSAIGSGILMPVREIIVPDSVIDVAMSVQEYQNMMYRAMVEVAKIMDNHVIELYTRQA